MIRLQLVVAAALVVAALLALGLYVVLAKPARAAGDPPFYKGPRSMDCSRYSADRWRCTFNY